MTDLVRARHWCPRCRKPGAWFTTSAALFHREIVQSLTGHQVRCTAPAEQPRRAA